MRATVEETNRQATALKATVEEAREAKRAARRTLDATKESVESSMTKYRRRCDRDRAQIGELEHEAVEVHAVVERAYSLLVKDAKVEFWDKLEGFETQLCLLIDEVVKARAEQALVYVWAHLPADDLRLLEHGMPIGVIEEQAMALQ